MATKRIKSAASEAAFALDAIDTSAFKEQEAISKIRQKYSEKRSAVVSGLSDEAGEIYTKLVADN